MEIKGFVETSLIDWDGKLCSVVSLPRCNFRCPWCQNAPLVLHPGSLESIDFQQILDFLSVNRQYIYGVCITGGEPSLYGRELLYMCEKFKKLHLKVKVDTNGADPLTITYGLLKNIIDYVAMDIKAPISKYSISTGCTTNELELANILALARCLISNDYKYEFRTTVVPTIHTPEDIRQIAKYALNGANKYVIQNFQPCETLIDTSFAKLKPFTLAELEQFKKAAEPYVKEVKIRSLNQNI